MRGARRASVVALTASVLAGLLSAVAAATPSPSGAPPGHIEHARNPIPGQYVVILQGVSSADVPQVADDLEREHHGVPLRRYTHAARGFATRMSAADALELSQDPRVASVWEDGVVHASGTQPNPTWGLDRIDQVDLPLNASYTYNATGSTVHAYIIDTGIHITHQDFGGRATRGVNYANGGGPTGDDCNGHGTHVSGTVGGTTYGVAKNVALVAVRVLDCSGSGSFSDVIAGVDWVTAEAVHPAVANMSLGGGAYKPLDDAVRASITSGVTYAIAAGNDNVDACTESPSRVTEALVVGAVSITDARASFSNWGTCVDLFAPGVSVTSDWKSSDTATNTISGTSMATPHVTGVAALYLEQHPTATSTQVMAAITGGATTNHVSNPGTGSPNLLSYSGIATPTVPGAPTGVTAAASAGQASVSWSAPATDGGPAITSYTVTSSPGAKTCVWSSGPLTCTVTGLTNGTAYTFTVVATNSVGDSSPSSPSSAVTPNVGVTVPGAPTGVSATAGNGQATVTWSAPIDDGGAAITSYTVTSSPGAKTCVWSSGPLMCTVTGLTNGTAYTFTVVATNSAGDSPTSSPSNVVTPATVPSAPTSVSATAGNGQATVTWSAPIDDGGATITSYTATSSPGAQTCVWSSGPLTCTVTGLTNGTAYTFTVVATNSVGDSSPSSPSTAVTPASVPGAPAGVSALAGDASATVSWSAPASDGGAAITGYTVTSSPDAKTCAWLSGPLTCMVTGLTNGTAYTFTVVATNSVGDSAASSASNSVTPIARPQREVDPDVFESSSPPRRTLGNVFSVAGDRSATVHFSVSAAEAMTEQTAVSYKVTASPGDAEAVGTSSPITITGLENGVEYTLKVAAIVPDGEIQIGVAKVIASAAPAGSPGTSDPSRSVSSQRGGSDGSPWVLIFIGVLVAGLLLLLRSRIVRARAAS